VFDLLGHRGEATVIVLAAELGDMWCLLRLSIKLVDGGRHQGKGADTTVDGWLGDLNSVVFV
jgi:hypothetical protein